VQKQLQCQNLQKCKIRNPDPGVHYSGCNVVPSVTSLRTTVSVILWSYPNAVTKRSGCVLIKLRRGDSACLCCMDFVSSSNIEIFLNAVRTAGTDSLGTVWDKLRAPLAHLLYLFRYTWPLITALLNCVVVRVSYYGGRGQATLAIHNSSPRKICGTKKLQKSQKVAK